MYAQNAATVTTPQTFPAAIELRAISLSLALPGALAALLLLMYGAGSG